MKTLQEVYDAILASDELKKGIAEALKDGKVEDFLKAQGCDATQADFEAFLKEEASKTKALTEEEMKNVAGGMDAADDVVSTMMPWTCHPNYSFTIDSRGIPNPGLTCA